MNIRLVVAAAVLASLLATLISTSATQARSLAALASDRLVVARTGTGFDDYSKIYSIKTDGTDPQLVRDMGVSAWRPRLSPDRQTVIYYTGVRTHPDDHQLWLANADGSGSPVLLIPKGGWPGYNWEVHGHAEWSHDNRYIVMAAGSNASPQIYVQDLLDPTHPSLRSTAQPSIAHLDPSFHPDGNSILYTRCPAASPCRGTNREIYLMATAGDVFVDLRMTTDSSQDADPHYSSNASTILFRRQVGCYPQIYKMPGAGGAPVAVVSDGAVNENPTWNSASSVIYFDRLPAGSNRQLAKISRNGGAVTPISVGSNCHQDFPNLTQNSNQAAQSGGLPMDRMLVATRRTDGPTGSDHPNREIYSMKQNGTAQTRLTTTSADTENWWPQLSPDRTKVLFYRGGTENDITRITLWIMNSDGTNAHELIPKQGPPGLPAGWSWFAQGHAAWSPDGNSLVMFAFSQGPGAPAGGQLWKTTKDGTNPVLLTTTQPAVTHSDPSWSHDGNNIFYVRCPQASPCGAGNQEIYITSAAGDQFADIRLTQDSYADYDPFSSPDGLEFAWLRNVSCFRWGIFKASTSATFPVTAATTVIDDGNLNSYPAWSRDSQFIFFHRNIITPIETPPNVWKVHSDGTGKAALNTGSGHCGVAEPSQSG